MKMRSIVVAALFVAWLVGPVPASAENTVGAKRADFAPVLTVGAKWRVSVEGMSEPPARRPEELVNWKPTKFVIVYRFLVEALETVDAEPCYRISINLPTDAEKKVVSSFCYYNRIYLRKAGFTLKRVERVDGRTERIVHSRRFDQPGSVDVTSYIGSLPMVAPSFQEGFDQDAFIKKDKDGKITVRPS
jgi:hypothetical protein